MGARSLLWHGAVTSLWTFGVYTNWFLEPLHRGPFYHYELHQYGGRLKYLTFLNGILQCVFFGLCVVGEVTGAIGSPGRKGYIQRNLDFLFTTLVCPLGIFVSMIFWSLYAVDRDLIFPVAMDAWFPAWLNHIMHTLPVTACLIELCLFPRYIPRGPTSFLPITLAYLCYLSWMCYIAYHSGVWVYPVFEVLEVKARSVFMAALLLPNLLFVYLCQKLAGLVHGSKKESKKKGKRA